MDVSNKANPSAEVARQGTQFDKDQFTKIIQDLAKKIESTRGGRAVSGGGHQYKIEEVIRARESNDEKTAREISRYFYSTSTSYARIVDHMANFYKYYYTLDLRGLSEGKGSKSKKLYDSTLALLDNLNIEQTFADISKRVLIDGAFFAYVNRFSETQVSLVMLDPEYCRSIDRSIMNTDVVQLNMEFFRQYKDEKELKLVLKGMPPEIAKGWRDFQKDSNNKWVSFPPEAACAFSFDSTMETKFPRLYDSIVDILNYEEYKEIEKTRDKNELNKILVQRFELDDDNNLSLLMEEMAAMHEAIASVLQDRDNIDVITSLAKDIKAIDVQEAHQSAQDNIQKMVMPKYEGSGISYELFGSTTATALERNLMNTTSFMSQLIVKYSNWLSMLCYTSLEYKNLMPIVTILPITWYNENKIMDLYLKGAQYGYSWILPYVASGKRQSTLLDTTVLEQEVLGLKDVMTPLSSSFTEPGGEKEAEGNNLKKSASEGQRGRPTLPTDEKSEKTIRNIESA